MAQSFKSWLNSAKGLNGADKQMSYQTYMSNSAHQREIEDLKTAGLNPVLSAGGNGASTPVGALDETANNESSGGYRLVRKSVDNSGKTANLAVKELGKAVEKMQDYNKKLMMMEKKSQIGLATKLEPNYDIKPTSFVVPDPEEIDFGKNAKMISLDKDFNERWKNNQLSWDDVKNYVAKENGTQWYDSQRDLNTKALPRNYNNVSGLMKILYNVGGVLMSDYRRNVNSKEFKEAVKHLSKQGYNDYTYWALENRRFW